MATYEYQNAAGERREIVASMKSPPPEVVVFDWHGARGSAKWHNWHPGNEQPDGSVGFVDEDGCELFCTAAAGSLDCVFRRVYSPPQIGRIDPGGEVNHPHQKGKPPTSVQLPRAAGGTIVNRNGHQCREIKPGLYATMDGKRIVDSKSAGDRHAADCGYVRTRED